MTLNRALFAWTLGVVGSSSFMYGIDRRLIFGNWGDAGGYGGMLGLGIVITFVALLIGILDTKEF